MDNTKSKRQSLTQNRVVFDLSSTLLPGQQAVEAVHVCRFDVVLHHHHHLVGSRYPEVNFGFIHQLRFHELHCGTESLLEVLGSLAVLPLVSKREYFFISYLTHFTYLLISPQHTHF